MKKIPAQLFSFDLVHAHYLGVTLFLRGGEGPGGWTFLLLGGESCTVSWGRLGGKFIGWGGGGGGELPLRPPPPWINP